MNIFFFYQIKLNVPVLYLLVYMQLVINVTAIFLLF